MMSEFASSAVAYVLQPFALDGGSRLHPLYWIVFVAGGLIVWALAARRGGAPTRSPLAFIFPRDVYLHRSSLTDLKVYIANHFVNLQLPGLKTVATSLVAALVAAQLAPVLGDPSGRGASGWSLALVTLLAALANDFTAYVNHRIGHEVRALWPFHAVHHSAEVLTPLTVYRKHPVFELLRSLLHPLCAGPMIGLIFALHGEVSVATILGVNAVYAVFNFAGANLRHSHLWISYGPWLSRILVSPAMHQIHHSLDPKHHNKNYGEILAVWDWMFGSLYVPRAREELTFGMREEAGDARVQPHPDLRAAYLRPFRDCAAVLAAPREAPNRDTPTPTAV
ncbi:MAG: sterol desaturase family protein [Caulobacterales bacterium]|nr:sterol desaturase family protein [Caulobacterales bacterium]